MPASASQSAAARQIRAKISQAVVDILTSEYISKRSALVGRINALHPDLNVSSMALIPVLRGLKEMGKPPFSVSAGRGPDKVTYKLPRKLTFHFVTTKRKVPGMGDEPMTLHQALIRTLIERKPLQPKNLGTVFGMKRNSLNYLAKLMEGDLSMKFSRQGHGGARKVWRSGGSHFTEAEKTVVRSATLQGLKRARSTGKRFSLTQTSRAATEALHDSGFKREVPSTGRQPAVSGYTISNHAAQLLRDPANAALVRGLQPHQFLGNLRVAFPGLRRRVLAKPRPRRGPR